jgi:hypothetical protein
LRPARFACPGALCLSRRRGAAGPAALLALSALPVVEHLQTLSVAFLCAGLVVSVAWLQVGHGAGVLRAAAGLARAVPVEGPCAAVAAVKAARRGMRMQGWLLARADLGVFAGRRAGVVPAFG